MKDFDKYLDDISEIDSNNRLLAITNWDNTINNSILNLSKIYEFINS